MGTKSMNVEANGSGTHTVTFGSGTTLSDGLLVAFDDDKLTDRIEAAKAMEAAGRAFREEASKATDLKGFPASGSIVT